jgi:hypothetical protein
VLQPVASSKLSMATRSEVAARENENKELTCTNEPL